MIPVAIAGVGLLGPGLLGWKASQAVLRGERTYQAAPLDLVAPPILSARERRRSGPTVRMALTVAAEATAQAGLPADQLASVFGSSNGSGHEVHKILEALATPEMLVSPTHFHNSVHNAAVGYWCIATSCHQPSTSIAGQDFTFPAALLKAAAQVQTEARPVLLALFDVPMPEPLHQKRPIFESFAAAFVLCPAGHAAARAELSLSWQADGSPRDISSPGIPELEDLWRGNPAARCLPLLEALALERSGRLSLLYPQDGRLDLELTI